MGSSPVSCSHLFLLKMKRLFSEESFRSEEMGLSQKVSAVYKCLACSHEVTYDNRQEALDALEEHFIGFGHPVRVDIREEIFVTE